MVKRQLNSKNTILLQRKNERLLETESWNTGNFSVRVTFWINLHCGWGWRSSCSFPPGILLPEQFFLLKISSRERYEYQRFQMPGASEQGICCRTEQCPLFTEAFHFVSTLCVWRQHNRMLVNKGAQRVRTSLSTLGHHRRARLLSWLLSPKPAALCTCYSWQGAAWIWSWQWLFSGFLGEQTVPPFSSYPPEHPRALPTHQHSFPSHQESLTHCVHLL